jgi:hypothetical protein
MQLWKLKVVFYFILVYMKLLQIELNNVLEIHVSCDQSNKPAQCENFFIWDPLVSDKAIKLQGNWVNSAVCFLVVYEISFFFILLIS